MANTTIDATAFAGGTSPVYGPFWFDEQIAVVVAINSGNDPARYYTSNGGSTWSETAISSSTNGGLYAWFDRNTIGYTPTNGLLAQTGGSQVHIVYTDSLGDTFTYVGVNAAGTVGTPVNIFTGVSFNTAPTQAVNCFIVRTRNGNLIAGYRDSTDSTSAVYRSTDGGSTWSSRTSCWETTSADQVIALQCNTGDDADAAIAFWDWDADEISIKVYDDSANTWTETSISGSMAENVAYIANMDAGILADGKCFLAAFSEFDSATADLKTWLLDINSVSSPTVTAKTDVLTNTDDAFYPAVSVDRRSGDIYVGYLTGSSATTVNPFYKKSTDTGSTWGSAVAFSDAAEGSFRSLHMGNGVSANGGRIVPAWFDSTNSDILTSLVADVVITSDVLVNGTPRTGSAQSRTVWGPFWTSPTVGAVFFIDTNSDLAASKTTDGGQTWGSASVAQAGNVSAVACWFEQETIGLTGDGVQVGWVDIGANECRHARYDIGDGTWGTISAIVAGGSPAFQGIGTDHCGIVETRNGNLLFGVTSTATVVGQGLYRSTDGGLNWSSRATVAENTNDFLIGVYCNTGDDADGAFLFWDVSANAISIKVYDDSANTVTETAVASSMVDAGNAGEDWDASTRISDGHVICVAWTDVDLNTADLKVFDLNINSVASPSVSTLTDAITNVVGENGRCAVVIDPSNDDLYAFYLRGTTWNTAAAGFYRKSTDDGSTWGSEVSHSQQVEDNNRLLSHCFISPTGGGRVMSVFHDQDDLDLFVNYNNSVSVAAVSGSLPDGKAVFSTVPRPKRALVVDELISPLTLGIPNEVEGLPTGRAIFDFIPRGKRGRGDQVDQPPLIMGIFQTPPEGKVYYDTTSRGERGRTDQVEQPPLALGVFHTPPDGRTWLQRNPLPKRGAWVDELKPPQTLGVPDEPIVTPDGRVHAETVLPPERGRRDRVEQPPLVLGIFHTPPEGRVQYSEPTFRGKRGRADFVLPPPLTLGIPDEAPAMPPGAKYVETTRRGKRGRPDWQQFTPQALEAESRVMSPFKPDVQLPRRKPRKIFDSLVRWYFLEESAAPSPPRPKLGLGRATGRAAQRGRGTGRADNLPRGRATGRH